jgi:hypothetical protein
MSESGAQNAIERRGSVEIDLIEDAGGNADVIGTLHRSNEPANECVTAVGE